MTQRTKLGAIIVLVAGVVFGLSVLLLNNPITHPANWCASGKDTDCWIITEGYQVRRVRKLCTERQPADCWYDANQAKREAAPNDAALKAPNWAFRPGKEGQ